MILKTGEKVQTYLRTLEGWVYLTAVIGLYDRKVIGWALSAGMEASETGIAALDMAVKNRRAQDGLICHSGRGVRSIAPNLFVALYGKGVQLG
jgi:transposase InsO family protein